MDLNFTDSENAFRQECRAWLEANVPRESLPSGDTKEGFALHLEWEHKLFDAGWAAVSWPKQYGGREATLFEWLIFEEEYYRVGAPSRVTQNGIFLLAPTLFEFGTDEQKERILRPMARGDVAWGQAWSEPNAGSDLASLKSTARRVDGGWRLTGQKTWSTRAVFCDMAYGLFRTDPEQTRHRGLTYFMFPLDVEGVTVRGVDRLDGDEGFAEIFLEDVFVPDTEIIGEVNKGWGVAMATTSSERGLSLRSPGRFVATAARLIDLYHRYRDRSDPVLRNEVIQAWMDAQVYRWFTFQTVTRMAQGESIGPDSSMNKVFWSEMDVRTHETALAIIGDLLELDEGADGAVDGGHWMKGFQFALAGPIYAGTNEIQRNIIAERVLGLPRK
ncbi:MAG: acyl-CoA dehydrogenase family protein [Deltaproteobacteria bacterium]|jgi:alkylation response protein AidB-like acyl-CoA dehydrogenase|nr:acyl-CoA dehydrogenase family protein [Deltaproteobacteria bacterium]MBW2158853.1 acyl-CoA dehydrogenase family protein [Deltaproteobacteria bacterium]MBW2374560.1 acyl-CoA dehydrogenase family protein [Deltaproteobacteria bacterium]